MGKKVVSLTEEGRYKEIRAKRRKKVNRMLATHIVSLFIFFCVLITGALYITSSYAKINVIQFDGLNVISKREIIELLDINYRDIVAGVDFKVLNQKLKDHPLIETGKIEPTVDGIKVSIKEKDILGCFVSDSGNFPITTTGELLMYDKNKPTPCYGVMFYDLDTTNGSNSIKLFATSLTKTDKTFLQRIEYVKQEPNYNDLDRYSITMRDGITIKVNAYSMSEKIAYYDEIVERIRGTYGNITGTLHLDVGDRFEADTDLVALTEKNEEEEE